MAARDDRQEAADTDPRAPRDRPVESELREQIRSRWQDLVAGRAPHDDIRRWARRQLEGSVADNELDIQGVLYLHGPADDPVAVARALEWWELEIVRCDQNPGAWMREHLRGVLQSVAQWKGVDRARVLGSKLVRNGHLTEDDVTLVLHSVTK